MKLTRSLWLLMVLAFFATLWSRSAVAGTFDAEKPLVYLTMSSTLGRIDANSASSSLCPGTIVKGVDADIVLPVDAFPVRVTITATDQAPKAKKLGLKVRNTDQRKGIASIGVTLPKKWLVLDFAGSGAKVEWKSRKHKPIGSDENSPWTSISSGFPGGYAAQRMIAFTIEPVDDAAAKMPMADLVVKDYAGNAVEKRIIFVPRKACGDGS